MYTEIYGDLIQLAKEGNFDVIGHGCNCFCTQGAGVALVMKEAYQTDKFHLEDVEFKGDINKLGVIEAEIKVLSARESPKKSFLYVVNCYTQYKYGRNHPDGDKAPFDYEAFTLCMRKMNFVFKGLKIGLPLIGGHLAGGEPERIKEIMKAEFKDCNLTLVLFKN